MYLYLNMKKVNFKKETLENFLYPKFVKVWTVQSKTIITLNLFKNINCTVHVTKTYVLKERSNTNKIIFQFFFLKITRLAFELAEYVSKA